MNIDDVSSCLKALLADNEKVALPGIGYFYVKEFPAKFSEDKGLLLPPVTGIVFSNMMVGDDGKLTGALSERLKITSQEVNSELSSIIAEIRKSLVSDMKYNFPGFGSLSLDYNFEFVFNAEKIGENDESEGGVLPPISLDAVDADITANPQLNITPEEAVAEVSGAAGKKFSADSPVVSDDKHAVHDKISEDEEMKIEIDKAQIEEEGGLESKLPPIPEISGDLRVDLGTEGSSNGDQSENPVEDPLSGRIKEEKEDLEVEEIIPAEEEANDIANSNAEDSQSSDYVEHEKKEEPLAEPAEDTAVNSMKGRALLITVSVIAIIVLAVIFLYVFRDQCRPFLEKLLYSGDELKTLKDAGML
ncbi:MAG: hypothetical protein LKI53_03095 [Bacteroidales bacterium]|jgi:nucleoid DNA-binding protein|nr:hypothetical protein [Bacteroidales bacterium]